MLHAVIIGGSYAGLKALRVLAGRPGIRVTLVDRHPYHFLQTEGYDLIAGKVPFDATIIGLRSLCAGFGSNVRFRLAVVRDVDFGAKKILFEEGEPLSYDYLIIAAGAVTRFFESVEGLRHYSSGVKSLRAALKLKGFFEQELYKRLESAAQAKEHYSILVGGAGLSGVEIAAEMQAYFNRYYRANALSCGRLQIHLVGAGPEILSGLHPAVVRAATKRLKALGVRLHTGARIVKVEERKAILGDGKSIPFDFMIFTGGIVAAPFVRKLDAEHNRNGQLKVTPVLQIPGRAEVFAVGDAADLRDRAGRRLPPTAQTAELSGAVAARNLLAMVQGRQPKKADLRIRGLAIALGGRYAIIEAKGIRIYGFSAYLGKKAIEKLYKFPLKFRARAGFRKLGMCPVEEG